MDCREVKKLLPEYLEKELSRDISANIRKHILSCRACSAELASLGAYKKALSSLKPIKAPADFLPNLNARLDKVRQPFLLRLASALFLPLRLKIPLEAAGLAAAAVIILIIFYPSSQIEKSARLAERDMRAVRQDGEKAHKKDDIALNELQAPAFAPAKERQVLKRAENKSITAALGPETKTYEIALLVNPASPEEALERKSDDGFYAQTRLQARQSASELEESAKSVSPPVAAEKESAESLKAGDIALADKKAKESRDESGVVKSESAVPKIAAKSAGSAIRAKDKTSLVSAGTEDEIKKIARGLKGSVSEDREKMKTGSLTFVVVEIPAERAGEFLERLKALGNIRQPAKKTVREKTGRVRYKVNIIHEK